MKELKMKSCSLFSMSLIGMFLIFCDNTVKEPAEEVPQANFTTAQQVVPEDGGTVAVVVTLSNAVSRDVTIPFSVTGTALNGTDYTLAASSVVVPAGETNGTITVDITNDTEIETDETVILTLAATETVLSGTVITHTITIVSEDVLSVSLTADKNEISEINGSAVLIAKLSVPSMAALSIPFTVTGNSEEESDYTLSSSSFSFAAGQQACSVSVASVDDSLVEEPETLTVILSLPETVVSAGRTSQSILIISDDAAKASLRFNGRGVLESCGKVEFIATLSASAAVGTTVPFTLGGNCEEGSDYTAGTTAFLFPAGQVTCTTAVAIVNDTEVEEVETLTVTLEPPEGIEAGDTTELKLFVFSDDGDDDAINKCLIGEDELSGWSQSPYESDLAAAAGDELFGIINGGAVPYIENGYVNGMRQVIDGVDETSLSFMAMYFGSAENGDSIYTEKAADISDPLSVPGYDADTATGYANLGGMTVLTRFGPYYFELVFSGFASQENAGELAKSFIDLFRERLGN
jgi:hypothetical protein